MSEAFKPFVQAVGRGERLKRDLTFDESVEALRLMLNGEASPVQVGAFLIAQRVKGEAIDEINGFIDVVRREFVTPLTPTVTGLLDLGTPYDGKAKTAQLTPAIALTLVAAGIPVILHGASDIPTKSGVTPAQVLTGLGVTTTHSVAQATASIDAHGFGYIDAVAYAPAWDALTPTRHQFGLRTVCNTVEKWFNPANAPYQLSGFFHGNYIDRLRGCQTGTERSFVVQGEEGSIEIGQGKRTPIFATVADDDVLLDSAEIEQSTRIRIEMPPVVDQHIALNADVLAGNRSAAFEQVTYTVGAILTLFGVESTWQQSISRAAGLLTDGAAKAVWERLS